VVVSGFMLCDVRNSAAGDEEKEKNRNGRKPDAMSFLVFPSLRSPCS